MNNKIKTFFAAGAILLAVTQVRAVPITGTVDMGGTVELDDTLLGSADNAVSFTAVTVGGIPTGSFAGSTGASVTWSPFGWNPSTTPVSPLWSFTDGTDVFEFELTSVSINFQNNFFLNLLGSGVLSATGPSGYTDTAGSWSFTISNSSGGAHANFEFTFANSQTAAVPDGGATAVLLGLAFLGVVGSRKIS